jgi:putative restriction endonuclease
VSVIERELQHRLDQLDAARRSPNWPLLTAQEVRDLGVYGGASGVWVDKARTQNVAMEGVAVGLLHTGRHYDDDIDDTGVLYHYPTTQRPPLRDENEVQAIKNARDLQLPIFVIRNIGDRKKLDLAWLDAFDDELRICVLTFQGVDPKQNQFISYPIDNEPTALFGPRRTSVVEVKRAERDPHFKFHILQRFKGSCLVTGISVSQMLDAAHIIPVARGGTESSENGLLLNASAHRAFDAGLWAINPETLKIETLKHGPNVQRMRFNRLDLSEHSSRLNLEALDYRYRRLFLKGVTT